MPGIKKDSGPHKYNKVNQQKKYHLLSLFYKRQLSLREAAVVAGINYLTAKTIIFFHKNNHKSYQFDLQVPAASSRQVKNRQTAFYTTLKKKNPVEEKLHFQKTRIKVICSIGNVLNPPKRQNNQLFSDLQFMPCSIKNEQVIPTYQKCSEEGPKSIEITHSPALAAVEDPQQNAHRLNLKFVVIEPQERSGLFEKQELIQRLLAAEKEMNDE